MSSNFFSQQDLARRNTRILVLLFSLALFGLTIFADISWVKVMEETGRLTLIGLQRVRLQAAVAYAPLFDMPRFAEGFADVAWRMADRHRKGLPPAPLG